METRDRTEILDALRRGQQAFLAALEGLPEDLAASSPGPGRWSALECAEHVAVSEDFLFSQLIEARPAGVPVVNHQREAAILARGADRTHPGVSPEAVRPTGRFPTLADALRRFLQSRAGTVQFVETCDGDLRSRLTTHPLLGPVNGYETLLLMAVHPHRHARQIDEIGVAARSAPT
ncbi:MAG: DinB family protein [Bryobacteraceae bacterium]